MDSEMAAKLSFIGRAGHPCGEDFIAAPFLAAHPEFAWEKPILHDMIAGPWTRFTADEKRRRRWRRIRVGCLDLKNYTATVKLSSLRVTA